jgi:hypothetical protein
MSSPASAGRRGMAENPMTRLEPLLGEWRLETSLGDVAARASFTRALGGAFLLQRAQVDLPEAPDVLAVIAADPVRGGYLQHYFDSRGVVRLYAMTFDGTVWTLLRDQPDFSPLDFAQRFTGTLSPEAGTIAGRWEKKDPGRDWELDFELTYVREG